MSKVLYPKKQKDEAKHAERPLHVVYTDPDDPTVPAEVRHYNSELAVKLDAWKTCRLVGFKKSAVLYTSDELRAAGALEAPR